MKANCNRCQKAAAVYCTAETAFMCATCDSQAHGTNAVACRHTRLALCQLCESAPATTFCKNDDAKLCPSCDAQIHVSNPLAARHERVPLSGQSYPETQHSVCAPLGSSGLTHSSSSASLSDVQVEAVPQLPNSPFGLEFEPDVKGLKEFDAFDFDGDLFDMGMGFDLGTLDMDFIGAPVKTENLDGVVPTLEQSSCCSSENESSFEVDGFAQQTSCTSSLTAQATPSLNTNGSDAIAAMPAVPTALPRPAPAALPAKLWSATSQSEVLHINSDGLMTREARVLRYRQKRARRTFQKTIRYQSRKAYAEIRPRIKGRFATREEVLALKAEQALKAAAAGSASLPTMVPCGL